MSGLATLEIADGSARLTMRREDARNALSIGLLSALHERVDELLAMGESCPIAVVMTGAGRSFCAGMDLKEVLSDPAAPMRLLGSLSELTLKLRSLPAVLIGRINGAAIGGGCGLTTVCDFSVTHADSKMGFPEVDLGVCPAVVAPWVVRRIGAGPARALLLRGGLISGRRAHELGLVTDLVETLDELDGATAAIVSNTLAGGPQAIRATKALLNELDGSLDADVASAAASLSAEVLSLPASQAALRARFKT